MAGWVRAIAAINGSDALPEPMRAVVADILYDAAEAEGIRLMRPIRDGDRETDHAD